MKSVGQVYTTPADSLKTGDWGVKYELLATPRGSRPLAKRRMNFMTLPEVDSALGLPVWKSGELGARFMRVWGGEGAGLRMKPEKGTLTWATDKGKTPDPWREQGERVTVSREYLHQSESQRIEAHRLRYLPSNEECEVQARTFFLQAAQLPRTAAEDLFSKVWSEWLAFVRAEEGEGCTLAEWMQKYGLEDGQFALELDNLRFEPQARQSFFAPDSLAEDPTQQDWELIVAHAQKRRLPLSNWEAVIQDLHDFGSPEDQVFNFFVKDQAALRVPRPVSHGPGSEYLQQEWETAVGEVAEQLKEDDAVGKAFVAFVQEIEESGQSLEEWVRNRTQLEQPSLVADADRHAPGWFNNPNQYQHLPDLAPDVERMSEDQFAAYLTKVKTLQPKYRDHLLAKLASNLERSGSNFSPNDTTLRGLQTTETLVPVKESQDFLQRYWAEASHEGKQINSARHPSGGLQYSLASRLETASAKPLQGFHLGRVPLPQKDRYQDIHSVGGLVVSGSPSNALGGGGLKPIDLGLTSTGQWRPEGRNKEEGKYSFRVDSATLVDPPEVVVSSADKPVKLEYKSIAQGPAFEFQAGHPMAVSVSRTDAPLDDSSRSSTIRTSPLDAYGRGELFLGGRAWVSGKKAVKKTSSHTGLHAYRNPTDFVRGMGRH